MDREKVIKGLELCVTDYLTQDNCKICPYGNGYDTGYCWVEMNTDALALLKEQEAVEPITMQKMDDNFSFFVPYFLCGNCRYELIGKDVMFCSHCGRSVKWE